MSNFTYGNKTRVTIAERNFREYWGLHLIDDEIEVTDSFGLNRSIKLSEDGNLVGIDDNTFSFKLRFILKDRQGQILPLDNAIGFEERLLLDELREFLFNKDRDYTVVNIADNKVIYCSPISAEITRLSKEHSYLEIEFESLSGTAYSPIITDRANLSEVNGFYTDRIRVSNNGLDRVNLNFTVKVIEGNGETVTITNADNGKSITLKDLNTGDKVYIDGDNVEIVGIDLGLVEGDLVETVIAQAGTTTVFDFETTGGEVEVILAFQEEQGV